MVPDRQGSMKEIQTATARACSLYSLWLLSIDTAYELDDYRAYQAAMDDLCRLIGRAPVAAPPDVTGASH